MKFPSLKTFATFIIIPIAGIVAVALRYDAPTPDDDAVINHTPAHAFQAPLPLAQGYLWHPADSNQIIYQPYADHAPVVVHDNLAGIPEQWTVAESSGNFQVAWVNDRAELWHAQLARDGNFSVPPVRLAEPTVLKVAITPLTDGEVIVLWQAQAQFTRPMFYALLDAQGRPRFQGQLLPDAEHFAIGGATETSVLMAWTVENNPTINYLTVPLENLRQSPVLPLDNPTTISLNLASGEWVNEMVIAGPLWVVWGVNQIAALDQTHFFAVNISDSTSILPIQWEGHRLRWLGNVRPATPEPTITLTAYTDGEWRPVLAKIEADGTLAVVKQWDIPADASAPEVWLQGGAAWVRLSKWGELTQTIAVK